MPLAVSVVLYSICILARFIEIVGREHIGRWQEMLVALRARLAPSLVDTVLECVRAHVVGRLASEGIGRRRVLVSDTADSLSQLTFNLM
jgi:hypothetical protein